MADVALAELYDRVRLESGLRLNAYYANTQILRYLNAGGAELYDLFTAANQHYNVKEYNFTTTGQASAIVSLPADFQKGNSLDIYPDVPGRTMTIRYLPNWLNRNSFAGNVFAMSPAGYFPAYTFLDNKLRFYPPQATPAAPFRLYYTPLWTSLWDPSVAPAFTPQVDPGPGNDGWNGSAFTFDNAGSPGTFAVGQALTVFNSGVNNLDGTYTITALAGGSTIISVTPSPPNATSARDFPVGSVVWITPYGTRATLSGAAAPWSEYLVAYSAIAVNTDRQRGTGESERKLTALKARIQSMLATRQEEVVQPPLSSDSGLGSGWGGGGWL